MTIEATSSGTEIEALLAGFDVPSLSGESLCLELGDTLLSASTAFNRQTAAFNEIVQLFQGGATTNLEASVLELARSLKEAREELEAESGSMSGLLDEGEAIARGLQGLRRTLRTMAALASRSRIEAANIARHDHDGHLALLSMDISRLAQSAEGSVTACLRDQEALMSNLQLSRRVQLEFNQHHRSTLEATERELTQVVRDLELHRSRTVRDSGELAEGAGHIAALIGKVVFALQIGDSTRQRLEHVRDAMIDLAPESGPSLAGQVCGLGAGQIEGARTQFMVAFEQIHQALLDLVERSRMIRELARETAQHDGASGGSAVTRVSGQLTAALAVLATCLKARAALDEAAAEVPRAIASLQERIDVLNDVGKSISFMGVNAFLKGARVGRDGAGFGVIAHDLRLNALSVLDGINELVPALRRVVDHAQQTSAAMLSRDKDQVGAFENRTRAALTAFTAAGQGLSDAVDCLRREGTEIERKLTEVTRARAWDEIAARMGALQAFVERKASVPDDDPREDELRALFWARYTMAEERTIHDAFIEGIRNSSSVAALSQIRPDQLPFAA